MRTPQAALAAAFLLSNASAAAQVVSFDNAAGTFVWIPYFENRDNGTPIIAERRLDLTLSPADNQAGLADTFRSLSYGSFPPVTPGGIIADRFMRFFPSGTAGIRTGEFYNYGTDAGFYAKLYQPGEQVLPTDALDLFSTNVGAAPHSETGATQLLGERITIGVRFQSDTTQANFHYGYVVLEWRDNLVFPNIAGGTSTLSMYQPVAWAYELTPNVAITVPEETDPGCAADTNADGSLTPADFSAWIAAFNAQAPACDQNGDTLCTPADFSAWIANYNAGC